MVANRDGKNAASLEINKFTETKNHKIYINTQWVNTWWVNTVKQSLYSPTLVDISWQRKKGSKEGKRRDRRVMLEKVEQDIDGQTTKEVDAVGTQEGWV